MLCNVMYLGGIHRQCRGVCRAGEGSGVPLKTGWGRTEWRMRLPPSVTNAMTHPPFPSANLLQRDPLVEYKLEGYNLFLEMMAQVGAPVWLAAE